MELQISIRSPAGKEPAALQWEITIPRDQLSFGEPIASPGNSVQADGKSVLCATRAQAATGPACVCVVSGGVSGIRNGLVAVLHLVVTNRASPGHARVAIRHAMAVFQDLTQDPIADVEAHVKIRRE